MNSRSRRPAPAVAPLPLCWHTRPDGSERVQFPALKPSQVALLFDLAERDRCAHPRKKRTVLHYGGHRFSVDCSVFGLRLWYRKVLVSRRWGFGL